MSKLSLKNNFFDKNLNKAYNLLYFGILISRFHNIIKILENKNDILKNALRGYPFKKIKKKLNIFIGIHEIIITFLNCFRSNLSFILILYLLISIFMLIFKDDSNGKI